MNTAISPIRVSTVLNILFPNSLAWVPEDALARGTRLHQYLEYWANSMISGMTFTSYPGMDEEERKRANAMKEWLILQEIDFLSTEEKIDHFCGFCGHPDLIGTWKWKVWTFDYKFAETITVGNLIQGEVYRHLTGNPVALIQCKRDASIHLHKLPPRPEYWSLFLSGLNVAKFHQTMNA